MKFRTKIILPSLDLTINHTDKIMMMGSCFVENISVFLQNSGFQIDVNPFGTVYNPCSLSSVIRELLIHKKYATSDLFEYQSLYHSFSHHSRFSDISPEACVEKINQRMNYSSNFFKKTTFFIITFGTSFIYNLKSTGRTVTNCHKLPDSLFDRARLSVENIVTDWNQLIGEIRQQYPQINFLFTVSPIRHWKDGAHENQLSKSILLLSIDELIRQNNNCYYFPSYELVLDELRDYRFYAEDMLHPSPIAIEYIWERFSETFFNEKTRLLISEWQRIQQALNHKPFNPKSTEHRNFLEKTNQQLTDFCTKNPEFSVVYRPSPF